MSYVLYENKKVYYHVSGQGRPVMLLHGNTASGRMFDFVLEELNSRYQVVVMDFLGHGQSDRLPVFPDDFWLDQAKQAIAVLAQEGLTDVVLVGTSGGAIAAVNAAMLRPDLFAFVIADSFQGGKLGTEQMKLIDEERKEKLEGGASSGKLADEQPVAGEPEEIPDTAFWEYCHGPDWARVVACDNELLQRLAGVSETLLAGPLEELAVPVLFTALEEDELIPGSGDIARASAQKVQQGRYRIFNEGSHPSMLTNWDEFLKLLETAVDELDHRR